VHVRAKDIEALVEWVLDAIKHVSKRVTGEAQRLVTELTGPWFQRLPEGDLILEDIFVQLTTLFPAKAQIIGLVGSLNQ
jgi:hypothetical protein